MNSPNWIGVPDPVLRTEILVVVSRLMERLSLVDETVASPTLSEGHSALALLYHYMSLARGREPFEELASRRLELAVEALSTTVSPPWLFQGFIGAAWTASHIVSTDSMRACYSFDSESLDLELLNSTKANWSETFDLISGLTGIGVYALQLREGPLRAQILSGILSWLESHSERLGGGSTWKVHAQWLPGEVAELYPSGYYDLGVAHGVAGLVGLLASLLEAGIESGRARALLGSSVAWILHHYRATDDSSPLPSRLLPGGERIDDASRLTWCRGVLGTASMLIRASLALREPGLWQYAVRLARGSASVSIEDSGIIADNLCHGTSGIALMFLRFYNRTHQPEFLSAAEYWYRRTLSIVDGELRRGRYADTAQGGHTSIGFLQGMTGTALALLAGTDEIAPQWDRVLLLS